MEGAPEPAGRENAMLKMELAQCRTEIEALKKLVAWEKQKRARTYKHMAARDKEIATLKLRLKRRETAESRHHWDLYFKSFNEQKEDAAAWARQVACQKRDCKNPAFLQPHRCADSATYQALWRKYCKVQGWLRQARREAIERDYEKEVELRWEAREELDLD